MKDLESDFKIKLMNFCPSENQRDLLWFFLNVIKNHDLATYLHSLSVSLRSIDLAFILNLDLPPCFFSGSFHDLGKLEIDNNILNKKYLTSYEFEIIKRHPLIGYFLVGGRYPFSADILVRHHRFKKKNPYPEEIPDVKKDKEMVDIYAEILALIDFCDAFLRRNDGKFKNKKKTIIELEPFLVEHTIISRNLINLVLESGIFKNAVL